VSVFFCSLTSDSREPISREPSQVIDFCEKSDLFLSRRIKNLSFF
jgi:hypothetical protein